MTCECVEVLEGERVRESINWPLRVSKLLDEVLRGDVGVEVGVVGGVDVGEG